MKTIIISKSAKKKMSSEFIDQSGDKAVKHVRRKANAFTQQVVDHRNIGKGGRIVKESVTRHEIAPQKGGWRN